MQPPYVNSQVSLYSIDFGTLKTYLVVFCIVLSTSYGYCLLVSEYLIPVYGEDIAPGKQKTRLDL